MGEKNAQNIITSNKSNIEIKPKKTLESEFGSNRISRNLKFSDEIIVRNDQILKYCIIKKDSKNKMDEFDWGRTKSKILSANLGNRTIQEIILSLIRDSNEFICCSSFLFENDTGICKELYDASKRGIRVYLLIASQHFLDKSKDDEENDNTASHKRFLNDAGKGLMYIRSGEVHSKFLLIDPKAANARGILLTANLTERATTKNNEIGVLLSPEQVRDLFQQFLFGFYSNNTTEYRFDPSTNTAKLEPISPISKNIQPAEEIKWTISTSKTLSTAIDNLLNPVSEYHELLISSWNIVDDNDISTKMLQKIGKNTKILLHISTKNYDIIGKILEKGAQIRFNSLQHAKFIVAKEQAVIMSANFESQGLEKGYESGILIQNSFDVDALRMIFNFWFESAEEIGEYNSNLESLRGKEIQVLSNESIDAKSPQNINKTQLSLSKIQIKEELIMKPTFLTWNLTDFITCEDNDYRRKKLMAELELKNQEYAIQTKYPVIIYPKSATNDMVYETTISGYPIWRKKNPVGDNKRYVIFDQDPFKQHKNFEKMAKFAEKEELEVILY